MHSDDETAGDVDVDLDRQRMPVVGAHGVEDDEDMVVVEVGFGSLPELAGVFYRQRVQSQQFTEHRQVGSVERSQVQPEKLVAGA